MAWYALVVTVMQTILALLLAVLLNAKIRGKEAFRTIFYTPSVTSSVVISMIFWWFFLKAGFLNYFLISFLGIFGIAFQTRRLAERPARPVSDDCATAFGGNIPSSQWFLRGPSVTLMAIMFQNIFTTIPTFMLMFLAALQDVPGSVYEAADIDGATAAAEVLPALPSRSCAR